MAGADSDLIARIKAVFDASGITVDLANLKEGFKQLEQASNAAFKQDLLSRFSGDVVGLRNAVAKLGEEYSKLSDTQKATALTQSKAAKDAITQMEQESAEKEKAIAANQRVNQQQAADLTNYLKQRNKIVNDEAEAEAQAYAKAASANQKINQQQATDLNAYFKQRNKIANDEAEAEAQAYAKADAAKIASNRAANQQQVTELNNYFKQRNQIANAEAEAEAQAFARRDAQILASQKSLFSALQSGASGNIGGMLSGVMQQAMAGTLPAGMSGGIGGILGAGGAGLTQTLGLASNLAPVVGGVTLLADATVSLGSAYLKAYNSSQDFLGNLRLIQKEMGTTATQTSQLTSFMGLTQNPNSPFSVIVFQQVAANLQNLDDIEHGVGEATGMSAGQINKMRDELDRLHVSIYNSVGGVKDITQFTLDLNKAMQGLDPARYAQAVQAVGGLFGKDFAAVIGTAPDQLQKLADSAVVVTQQMLNLAEARKVAYAISTNAEQQFNIELTKTLIPLDLQIQAQKQLFLMREALVVQSQQKQGSNIFTGIAAQVRLDAMTPQQVMDEWKRNNAGTPQEQLAYTSQQNTLKRATDDYKFTLKEIGLVLDAGTLSQKNYTAALKDASTALGAATTAAGQLNTVNSQAITGFESTVTGVLSAGRGYENYYKQLRDQKETVAKLDKLSGQSVSYAYYQDPTTGERINPTSVKAMKTYVDAYNKAAAQDVYDAVLKQGKIDTKELLNQQAAERAGTGTARTTVNAKGVSKTTIVGGKGLTNAQALGQQQAIENLTNGTPTDAARAQVEQMKLDALAEAAGLPAGLAPTSENMKTGWAKRGLSESEINQRAAALEQIQQLDFADKDAQLKMMVSSASDFVKQLAAQEVPLDKIGDKQSTLNRTSYLMAQNLQMFAKSAGMFDSAGFVRAMGEAALSADLANKKFGDGPEALQKYFDKFKLWETTIGGLSHVLSGEKNITIEEAVGAGLITQPPTATEGIGKGKNPDLIPLTAGPDTQISWIGPDPTEPHKNVKPILTLTPKAAANAALTERIRKGEVGAGEVGQLIAQKQNIDTQAGIMGMYDQTYGVAKAKADQLTQGIADDLTKITDKMYEINISLSDKSVQGIADQLDKLGVTPSPGAAKAVKSAVDIGKEWGIDFTSTDIPGIRSEIKQKITDLSGPNPVIPLPFMGINAPVTPTAPIGLMGPYAPLGATGPLSSTGPIGAGFPIASGLSGGLTGTVPMGGFPSALGPVLGLPAAAGPEASLATPSINDQVKKALAEIQTTTVDTHPLLAKQEVDMSVAAKKARDDQVMQARAAMQTVLRNNPLYVQIITTSGTTAPPPAPPPGGPPPGVDPLLPHGAIGGVASAGRPMWIGENGPEVFWPGANGYIIDAIVSRKLMRDSVDRPVYPRQPAIIFNAESPTNNISIDARGSYAPASTVMAVRNATETFMSNDPRIMARMALRRKGQL